MLGSNEIAAALNVEAVTTLLDTDNNGDKALYSDNILPSFFEGDNSINFYMSQAANMSLNYGNYVYTVNCRAATYTASRTIAQAAITEINRVHYTDYFIICSILPTIHPMDETDNYNTPISVTIKTR